MVINHDHDIIWTEAYMDSVVSCLPFLVHPLFLFAEVGTVHKRWCCTLSQTFILIIFAFINLEPLMISLSDSECDLAMSVTSLYLSLFPVIPFQLPNTAEVNSFVLRRNISCIDLHPNAVVHVSLQFRVHSFSFRYILVVFRNSDLCEVFNLIKVLIECLVDFQSKATGIQV